MRITNPIPLLALSAGLLSPASPAQGGMTEQMREEIRSIVRQEIRAALRELRAEPEAVARVRDTDRRTDRKTDRRADREKHREKAEDHARGGFGVVIRGDEDVRWITRPKELDTIEVELEEIDSLLDDIDVQLKSGLRDIEVKALPRIQLKLDTDLEKLRSRIEELHSDTMREVDRKLRIGDRILDFSGGQVRILGGHDHDGHHGKDDDGKRDGGHRIKVFQLHGDGDAKVEGKAKVKVWTDDEELLDKTYEIDGKGRPGTFRLWVEDGKVKVDDGGGVKVFRLHRGDDAEVEIEVEELGEEPDKKPGRRMVRRRTMV